MAPRPHDGPEPDEPGRESGDPGRPDQPDPSARPGLPDPEVEERWVEIVTHLGEPALTDEGPADDGSQAAPGARRARDAAAAADEASDDAPPASDPRGWVPDDVEEHFDPPDPGPVLGGDPLLTMAWIAVVGPPALLLVSVVAWQDIPTLVLQVAGVAFLAGLGVLFWRMPPSRDEDDGPGAVV